MEIKDTYAIGSSLLTYDIIEKILKNNIKLTLSEEAKEKIRHCREYLDSKADADAAPIYGVTTGFGSLCNKQIYVVGEKARTYGVCIFYFHNLLSKIDLFLIGRVGQES